CPCLLSSRCGRNSCHWSDVRGEARRTVRCEPGKSGPRCIEPVCGTWRRLSGKWGHVAVACQRRRRCAYTTLYAPSRDLYSCGGALFLPTPERFATTSLGGSGLGCGSRST